MKKIDPLETRICPICSNEFALNRIDKIFCSQSCKKKNKARKPESRIKRLESGIHKNAHRKYYKPVPRPDSTKCKQCAKEFTPKRKTEFCSTACRDKHRNYYTTGKGVLKHCVCPTCNTQFITNQKRKYCTPKCSPSYKELFTNKDIRTCESCNNDYLPRYRAQRFCTRKCRRNGYIGYKNSERAYYNSKEWKLIRATFIQGYTSINGIQLSNKYCIKCYIQQNRLNDMYAVDHIIPRKQSGSDEFDNLQSLCKHHHQSKSAVEGNLIKDRNKGGRPKKETSQYGRVPQ